MANVTAKTISASWAPDRVHVRGDVNQELRLLADKPLRSLLKRPTPRGMDLLGIAAAVYAADRAIKRRAVGGNDTGARDLRLTCAVHDLAFWSRPEITYLLGDVVAFLTGENWTFSFQAEPQPAGSGDGQLALEFPWTNRPRRVALYSGGLDSAAGLGLQTVSGNRDYVLVTVGHQSGLRRRCSDQIRQLAEVTQTAQQFHVTLVAALRQGVAKRISMQERSQRSRAFLFCSAAAAVAQAFELEDIDIFENGIGAINLPLMAGMLGNGLSTRGAHPSFMSLMSQLASEVAGRPVRYNLPFGNQTKGEMLAPLKAHNLADWLQLSRSCVHTSLRERGKSHCGQCPGCIERRQAFHRAGITERVDDHYRVDVLAGTPLEMTNADYLRRYIDDSAAWLADNPAVLQRLDWHLKLTDVPTTEHQQAAERQRAHAQEVASCFSNLIPRAATKRRRAPSSAGRSIALDISR